ncbi:MAG TPA: SIS domain-containing protein, partial [Nitrospiraceae bacterium]|nr:SIS domain-containing protein [Nitrospiraceae bacterium]
MSDRIIQVFEESADIKRQFARIHAAKIAQVGQIIGRAVRDGYKVLLFGNGGSSTDASHIAAEFVGRYHRDRAPMPALALATDMAAI